METSRFRVLSLSKEAHEKIYSGKMDELTTSHKDMIALPGSSHNIYLQMSNSFQLKKVFSEAPNAAQSHLRKSLVDMTMESRLSGPRGPMTTRELRLIQRN